MKTINENSQSENPGAPAVSAPAAAPIAGFQTPHELALTQTPEKHAKPQKPAKVKAKRKTKKVARAPKAAGKDAFGGRVGTRMSKINLVVISAGKVGATVPEVAKKSGESVSLVSAQLGWMMSHKKVATREQETGTDGKKVFRYFAKPAKTNDKKGTK